MGNANMVFALEKGDNGNTVLKIIWANYWTVIYQQRTHNPHYNENNLL